MDQPESESPQGILASVRRMGNTLLATLQTRLELFAVELEEEKERLLVFLLWAAAAGFFGILAVIMVTLAIAAACPSAARPYVLGGFGLLYLMLASGAALGLRKRWRERPRPFAATLEEVKKDVDWLRSQS